MTVLKHRRVDYSFGTGLIDFLVENHTTLRGKVLKLESLSRKTRAWGLEPELSQSQFLAALRSAVEACPYLDLAKVGREEVVAFALDAKSPFSLLQMLLASNHGAYELLTPSMRLYVRHGTRYLAGEDVPCLDIAKVWVHPRARDRGLFTRLIEQVEASIGMAIYIESIVNPILVPFFIRRGYTCQYPEALRPCFFLLPTNEGVQE